LGGKSQIPRSEIASSTVCGENQLVASLRATPERVEVPLLPTMNDRYGAFDLDTFGNGYQGAATVVPQPRPRYSMTGNGSHMDEYDPTRLLDPRNMATYNPTAPGTVARASATHQTIMPSTGVARANGLRVPGFPDFEPIPLSTAAIHRLTSSPSLALATNMAVAQRSPVGVAPVAPSTLADFFDPPGGAAHQRKPSPDTWLVELRMEISGLSLEPLPGTEVVERVETRSEQVVTRYLPCVDFLVQCQQELRKGLAAATAKRLVHHMFRDAMTPRQFFNTYISNLPERFYRKNRRTMKSDDLTAAVNELQKLCTDARAVERQGCEVVKNTFLGGMKDGESWGLRKWLSKHGGALHICNDCECVLHSCQKLDRSLDSTRKLSERMRPLAKKAWTKLKADVPTSYQEHSSAHPYLPFFHRLEAALRGMSTFDPEDDDVICIDDDDEVEELKAQTPPPKQARKRKAGDNSKQSAKRVARSAPRQSTASDSDDDSIIEILDIKPAGKASKKEREAGLSASNDDSEYMKALLNTFDDDASDNDLFDAADFDSIAFGAGMKKDAFELAAGLDRLAMMFDSNQQMLVRPMTIGASSAFWDESMKYASALRLLSQLLRSPDASALLERIDEEELAQVGNPPYALVIRHPLCFRDVVTALVEETDDMSKVITGSTGKLPAQGLTTWNMWRGKDLLQAIDLVFLNSLAYGKAADEGRSNSRSNTNKLRKLFWTGIKTVIDSHVGACDSEQRRKCMPTRRGESSGFIVHKYHS
jgi:hypothetical protein